MNSIPQNISTTERQISRLRDSINEETGNSQSMNIVQGSLSLLLGWQSKVFYCLTEEAFSSLNTQKKSAQKLGSRVTIPVDLERQYVLLNTKQRIQVCSLAAILRRETQKRIREKPLAWLNKKTAHASPDNRDDLFDRMAQKFSQMDLSDAKLVGAISSSSNTFKIHLLCYEQLMVQDLPVLENELYFLRTEIVRVKRATQAEQYEKEMEEKSKQFSCTKLSENLQKTNWLIDAISPYQREV